MSLVAAVRAALAPAGLNLVAAVPVTRYDREVPERFHLRKRYPGAQTVIVIGNGGGAFWEGFRRHEEADPGFRTREANPLDRYTMMTIERTIPTALARLGVAGHIFYPFQFDAEPVSFVHLGAVAGLGGRSVLGVLVHREYGPWMALRAAVLLDVAIEATPLTPFDPCGTCADKPCMSACPVAAIGERGWDVPKCAAHRMGLPLPRETVDKREDTLRGSG